MDLVALRLEEKVREASAAFLSPTKESSTRAALTNQGSSSSNDSSQHLTNNTCRGSSAPVPPGSLGWCSTKRDINGIHVNGPSGSPWVILLAFHHAIYSSMVSDHWSPMASVLLESSLLTFTFSFWIKKQRTTFTFTTGNTSLSHHSHIFPFDFQYLQAYILIS